MKRTREHKIIKRLAWSVIILVFGVIMTSIVFSLLIQFGLRW